MFFFTELLRKLWLLPDIGRQFPAASQKTLRKPPRVHLMQPWDFEGASMGHAGVDMKASWAILCFLSGRLRWPASAHRPSLQGYVHILRKVAQGLPTQPS